MFSSGSSTGYAGPAMYRTNRITLTEEEIVNARREAQAAQQAHRDLIKKAAIEIFSNPDQLKNCLEQAAKDYLIEIKDKWFRNNGRHRAEELIKEITHLKTTGQLISVLTEVINAGNEEEDSLKTFIFNIINLNFFDKKLDNYNVAFQLKGIIAKITEIKMLYDKNLLLYAGMRSVNSNLNQVPQEIIIEIKNKLNNL